MLGDMLVNKISFYNFFMVHFDYLIERYLCSMAFSAFTRHHLQFCSCRLAHQILHIFMEKQFSKILGTALPVSNSR